MKIYALYLPQYHEVPENNLWWGNGYTEWTSCKRGKALLEGQYQPRVPLNDNYYNLLDIDVMRWQTEIAKTHGISGFCMYHYWFNGSLLLEKPVENYKNSNIDFPYYICWANEQWTTVWEGEREPRVLMSHDYSNTEDIDKHFFYMLPFFKDKRYVQEDNKPVFCIYNPIAAENKYLKKFICRWNDLAKQNGFEGITFTYLCAESMCFMSEKYKKLFKYGIEYEPSYVEFLEKDAHQWKMNYVMSHVLAKVDRICPAIRKLKRKLFAEKSIIFDSNNKKIKIVRNYDEDWEKILSIEHDDYSKYVTGGFVDWDNTPRRGYNGKIIVGATPEKFKEYLKKLIIRTKTIYKNNQLVLFAWNEWSEGGYLEPDKKWGFSYLEAVKSALMETDEWENDKND